MARSDTLDRALEFAYQAGRSTLGVFRTGVRAERKADDSPVTVADRAAEEMLRSRLAAAFPHDGVLGEEYGEDRPDAPRRWILDPIDGTKAFVRGVPLYATLLALEVEGVVELGVAYFPALGEMLYAERGGGAYLDGRRVRVSATTTLADAALGFTDAGTFEPHGRGGAWRRLVAATRVRAGWGDAYGHALVASGRLELMLDPVLHPWDCAPFAVILPEAGGWFGDWGGQPTIYGGDGLSTTAALRDEVLSCIADAPEGR